MNYFTDLIAKSYLNSNRDIDIALFYFNEFIKVRPGVEGDFQFSKDYFFKKLFSSIDLLIDTSYTNYSDPLFDPSEMDYETYEYELNQKEEINREVFQNDIQYEEFNKEKPINWEECEDAGKLTYALKYKCVSLKDPINIIRINDENRIVLRKSILEFLKFEAEKANISTIIVDRNYLFDESSYLKSIEDKSHQDKSALNLKKNNINEVNSESIQILSNKIDNIPNDIESIKTNEPQSDFLTSMEAAKFLNLSINTIYSKTCNNKIPFMKNGKKLIFSRVELIEYIKSARVKTRTEIDNDADNFKPKSKRK